MVNKSLRILYIFNGLFVLAGSLLGPLYAIYVEKITQGVFPVALSWSMFLFSATLFTMLVAKFGDRVKEKEYLLIGGFLIRAFCWLAYIFVGDFYVLLIVQFLLGVGEAVGTPAFDAIFAEHLDGGRYMREYSNWKIICNFALVVGTLLGGALVQYFGFDILFIIMSCSALLAAIGIYMQPRKLL